jgi:hypothetical protein
VLKSDLAGGQLPSGLFGANAAWWALAILALNLNAAMKQLVLGKDWIAKRLKALRFHLIGLPGRVVSHARQLIVRLGGGGETLKIFITARQIIRTCGMNPSTRTTTPLAVDALAFRAAKRHRGPTPPKGLATVVERNRQTRHPCGRT